MNSRSETDELGDKAIKAARAEFKEFCNSFLVGKLFEW